MKNEDIMPGVVIENIHHGEFPGHTTVITSVSGPADDDTVTVEMRGPNGVAPLYRRRELIRDHFRKITP